MPLSKPTPMDIYHETYDALIRLRQLDPEHEFLDYLTDFESDWNSNEDEEAFRIKFRPHEQASLDEAIVEFLAKVEDIIFDEHGAPEWSHESAPLRIAPKNLQNA